MARIKIKNKNSLPKGFTIRDGKVIKTYAAGGATVSNTLKPVDREAANLEAEKGEMVLTDTSGDGVFELYDVGGKRHNNGGTPLNLPDQSFVYSDTKGMLLTKDEMKALGIEQKKRITPAKAAKKFPLNKYIEILEDETSDKIAVETAEQMINKNKIMLSQIAFIQESKKDFENGLPLAAFPYLMSKGVDPQQFQAKIDEVNAEKNPQEQAPQGMTQGMPPQGMPPQGMMPPQPPTNMEAQGMMPPQPQMAAGGQTKLQKLLAGSGFSKKSYSVAPPNNEYGLQENPKPSGDNSYLTACPSFGNPPPSASLKQAADNNNNLKYGGDLMSYQTMGEVEPEAPMDPFPKFQTKGEVKPEVEEEVTFDLATKCKNTLCTYDEWRFAYRLKDIKEVRFMYESYKTKALDKMKAPEIDTRIMPGHENLKNMPYGNMPAPKQQYGTETGQSMVPQMGVPQGYVRDQNPLGLPGYQTRGEFDSKDPCADLERIREKLLIELEWAEKRSNRENKSAYYFDEYEQRRRGETDVIRGTHEKLQQVDRDIQECMIKNRPKIDPEKRLKQKALSLDPITPSLLHPSHPLEYRYGGGLRKFVYGGQDDVGISMEKSVDIELDPVMPSYTSNPMYRSLSSQLQMMQMDHANAIKYHQENPHMFKEEKAQKEFEEQINQLQAQMRDVELQMRSVQRDDVLRGSIMDLDQSIPNVQIADPSMYTGSNPVVQGTGMMMARNGMELPRMDKGAPICTGSGCGHTLDHDSDKFKNAQKGRDAHMEFYNHVMGEDFAEVRRQWIDSYKNIVTLWDNTVSELGGIDVINQAIKDKKGLGNLSLKDLKRIVKNKPVSGKSDDELFDAYMAMNDRLLQAKHAGYKPAEFSQGGYKKICQELGWGDCDGDTYAENAKIFQGMFTAMQELKNDESDLSEKDAFFGNITLDLKGKHHGNRRHIDERTGLPMSDIDGIIGMTSAGQWSSAKNEVYEEEIITEIECDEAEQKRVAAECLKLGQKFDLDTCSCQTVPKDPEEKDIPPYMTFPQDDLRLMNAIDQKWSRNLYMPTRQNVDPVLPDVAYQDPQAMIQANLSMAQQLAKADPENASYYMGMISDKINKGISDISNTNIKIFDNNEARKSTILNDAMATNAANRDEYNTRVATALNNFDNTMIADNANIVDTQVDRMDHADKLYALNMENPNYYYDAQNHMNMFYNPNDLIANKEGSKMTMEKAKAACHNMNFKEGSSEMLKCIEQYMGANATPNPSGIVARENETDVENTAKDNTEEKRYGSEIGCTSCSRKKELARSRKALRDWIFGV